MNLTFIQGHETAKNFVMVMQRGFGLGVWRKWIAVVFAFLYCVKLVLVGTDMLNYLVQDLERMLFSTEIGIY